MKEAAVRVMGIARSDRIVMLATSEDLHFLERAQHMWTSTTGMHVLSQIFYRKQGESVHFALILIEAGFE